MQPTETCSVTQWIANLINGDRDAARLIFDRYFPALVRVARAKLKGNPRWMNDEEDIALSAMRSLCRGAEQGRFPNLSDRHDLWALLLAITAHKAIDAIRWETREKRGTRAGESTLRRFTQGEELRWDHLIGDDPAPEFLLALDEEHNRLLSELPDDVLREIAIAKMEGYTNEEIAQRLGVAERTVYRKLNRIKELWSHVLDQSRD